MAAKTNQPLPNKALHPTAYSPSLVPRYGLPAAGELVVGLRRAALSCATIESMSRVECSFDAYLEVRRLFQYSNHSLSFEEASRRFNGCSPEDIRNRNIRWRYANKVFRRATRWRILKEVEGCFMLDTQTIEDYSEQEIITLVSKYMRHTWGNRLGMAASIASHLGFFSQIKLKPEEQRVIHYIDQIIDTAIHDGQFIADGEVIKSAR